MNTELLAELLVDAMGETVYAAARLRDFGTATEHAQSDPGLVPDGVLDALIVLAAEEGYTVSFSDMREFPVVGKEILGATQGALGGKRIVLLETLSAASRARVLCHELSHVLLGHVGATPFEDALIALAEIARREEGGALENASDEVEAELSAAAVMAVAGLGSGLFSQMYLRNKMDAACDPEVWLKAAAAAARLLGAVLPYASGRLPALV